MKCGKRGLEARGSGATLATLNRLHYSTGGCQGDITLTRLPGSSIMVMTSSSSLKNSTILPSTRFLCFWLSNDNFNIASCPVRVRMILLWLRFILITSHLSLSKFASMVLSNSSRTTKLFYHPYQRYDDYRKKTIHQ